MKRTIKKASVFLLAALMLATMFVPAMAVNTYTPISGGKVPITETLYLQKSDTIVPTVTYTLALANPAGPYKASTDSSGNVTVTGTQWTSAAYTGTPTVSQSTVSFAPGDTVSDLGGTGEWQRYVEKSGANGFEVDFSNVQFKEPGLYVYKLTKSSSGADAGTASNTRAGTDTATENYICVYVKEKDDGTLTLESVTYTNNNSTETAAGKTIGKSYLDQYPATNKDLTVSKTVSGNGGSKTQYFQFSIQLSGGVAGAKYLLSGNYDATTAVTEYNATAIDNHGATQLNAAEDPSGSNKYYITLDPNGAYSGTVWMQHGQSVTIKELPKNMSYTVDEVASTATGYTETHTGEENGKIADAAVTVAYTNTKTTTTPTGILLQYGAPIAGVLLVAGLLAVLFATKRRKEQEAE